MVLSTLLFLNLGGGEIFVIMLVILLFFGSKRIPDLAKGLGKGMREFKDAMNGIENEVRNAANDTTKPASNPPAAASPKKIEGEVNTTNITNSEDQK
ncbi:MAG: twin-arginine translocase TatA/TatE family subunit [Bacteroidia bacterium]